MNFYALDKTDRKKLVEKIHEDIFNDLGVHAHVNTQRWFSAEDTYLRKAAYLSTGRIYQNHEALRTAVLVLLRRLMSENDFKIRQTVINAAGEIGKKNFEVVQEFFDTGLFDHHHSPRNAVIGSIKKMGEVNPVPVLDWARKYLHHKDKEIRREICHGIELRGRKHPADILPMLKELEFDPTARVRNTLIHVIGQIAYKKGCLPIVISHLKTWQNTSLVKSALEEIIDVHHRYRNFSALMQDEARQYIENHYYNRAS
jgi:hypothetical protein